ncbi:Pentatricopeptide repeat-containing protein mitochondrial [Spatholobus suberectus]|nr:Pentatricopeptide repeat-containing protein mitochondrial [Spatholobus suberectus]
MTFSGNLMIIMQMNDFSRRENVSGLRSLGAFQGQRRKVVQIFASHGQLSEALLVYEEIKKGGHNLEPKAITSLTEEFTQVSGELDGLLLLHKELSDIDYWSHGCFRVIMYCIRNRKVG